MGKRRGRKGQSIFSWILVPMMILLLIETILFAGTIAKGGVAETINRNQAQIVEEKVKNRKTYLETEMLGTWSDLNEIVQTVNSKAQEAEMEGTLDLSKIDQGSSNCQVLLEQTSEDLIETLRAKSVNGIFVVFNNQKMSDIKTEDLQDKPGFYIRDNDPTTNSSEKNSDLLIERGSVELVRKLGISTDRTWTPTFEFAQNAVPYYDFLKEPHQQGVKGEQGETLSHAGYWSAPYSLYGDDKQAISYSLPLKTEDGRVYGVLGVEILTDYLEALLPAEEIQDEDFGSYVLTIGQEGTDEYQSVVSSGNTISVKAGEILKLKQNKGVYQYGKNYCALETVSLYDTNTAFADQKWTLMGMVPQKELDGFSEHIIYMLLLSLCVTVVFGIVGTMLLSYFMTSPIRRMSDSMDKADIASRIELDQTGIKEIDHLGDSIVSLSSKLKESASKFTKILELASVKIAAYELNTESGEIFITDNFFEIFGRWEVNTRELDITGFLRELELLEEFRQPVSAQGAALYQVTLGDGIHYIKIKNSESQAKKIGLAEDITNSVLERRLLERERDYDLLTGLRNRRAFIRKMNKLFGAGDEVLKKAALIMIDLDNLKQINDTYGHDTGDKYIRKAADAFRSYSPESAVLARISGDEFYLFYYGYDSEEEIQKQIEYLRASIANERLKLPNGETFQIRVSGGYAWYPRNTKDYEELLKFSDFAMYQVKHHTKGSIREFVMDTYQKEMFLTQNKQALTEMIERMSVKYYFQPIVEAGSGRIFAYEALMRGDAQALHYPSDILELAKRENKLGQIEVVTWMKALESYEYQLKSNRIGPECKIFINSMAAVHLDTEHIAVIEERYYEYLKNVVLELTEEEKVNQEALRIKQMAIERWGAQIALDDFGAGYNGEATLLQIAPKYIKVDRSIITDINKNQDKRKLVSNILSYAKTKHMFVIAEGVETGAEAETVVKLGVDYLQGYYIARPDPDPPEVSPEVCFHLRQWNEEMIES